jgi:hypothetical protein
MYQGYRVLDHYEHALIVDTTHLEPGGLVVSAANRIASLVDTVTVVNVMQRARDKERGRERIQLKVSGKKEAQSVRERKEDLSPIFPPSLSSPLSSPLSSSPLSYSFSHSHSNMRSGSQDQSSLAYSPPSPYQGFQERWSDGEQPVMIVKIPATNSTDNGLFAVRSLDGSIRAVSQNYFIYLFLLPVYLGFSLGSINNRSKFQSVLMLDKR